MIGDGAAAKRSDRIEAVVYYVYLVKLADRNGFR